MIRIDLNCDLGESAERVRDGTDARILASVTSANIACGGHAGDALTMEATLRAALRAGTAVGAHPGFPDRASFGRATPDMTPSEIEALVKQQVSDLDEIAQRLGAVLSHVKPHGGLYHAANRDEAVARAIARATAQVREGLILIGLAGSSAIDVWKTMGFAVAAEAFADRAYEANGTLRARSHADAVLRDPALAAAQALRIACDHVVVALDGTLLPVRADTLCVHGDTAGADVIARAVRGALEGAGIAVRALPRNATPRGSPSCS